MSEGLVAADEQGPVRHLEPGAEKIVGMGADNVSSQQLVGALRSIPGRQGDPFPADQNPLLRAIRGEVSTAQMFVRNPGLDEAYGSRPAGPLKDRRPGSGGGSGFPRVTQKRWMNRKSAAFK